MKSKIISKAGLAVSKLGFKMKKKSPEILVITGIVGLISSGVAACVATLKVSKVTQETKEKVEEIHQNAENGYLESGELYDEHEMKKDLTKTYAHGVLECAKLYALPVAGAACSTFCIIAGFKKQKGRTIALATMYATLDKNFKDYRKRVADRFGPNVEDELRYDLTAKEVEKQVTDEKGKTKTVKELKTVAGKDWDLANCSPYAIVIDETWPRWMNNPEEVRRQIMIEEQIATQRLKAKGHLFLNEVYDDLIVPRKKLGQSVGWISDIKHPKGDDFVEFKITPILKECEWGEYTGGFIVDFNACGDILDDMPSHQYNV